MKFVAKHEFPELPGTDKMTLMLVELKNGYGVYYYIHCEDRYSEVYTSKNLYDAQKEYNREKDRREVKDAILKAALERMSNGDKLEHIRRFQNYLLAIPWLDADVRDFVQRLDRMVFSA